jgi:PAS domain S-box-containing protein
MNQEKSEPKPKISPKAKIGIETDNSNLNKTNYQDSSDFLPDLFSSISDVIYATDLQLRVTYWNRAAERVYGLKERDVLGKSIVEVTGSKFDSETREILTMELLEKSSVKARIEHKSNSGISLFFESRTMVHTDKNGIVIGFISINREITDLKQSEEVLRRSHKLFSDLIEKAPFGIYVIDSGFRIANMNSSSQTGTFRNVRPLIGRNFSEAMHILWPVSVAEGIIANFRHTLTTGEAYYSPRFTNPRHDAEIVESYEWELHRITIPDGQYGVICYYFDSTNLRDAEKEALESEKKYRRIVETANEGIMSADTDGNITFVNSKMAEMLGYSVNELIGKPGLELIYKDELEQSKTRIELRKKGNIDSYDIKFICRNGKILDMHANGAPIFDSEGLHIGNLGMYTDITKQKQAKEELAFQARLLSEVREAIFSSDINYTITYWNQAAERMFGWTKDEALGKISGELLKPKTDVSSLEEVRSNLRNKGYWEGEGQYLRKDGTYFFVEVNSKTLKDAEGKYIGQLVVVRDITVRKQAETRLKEAQSRLNLALEKGNIGIWEWNIMTNEVTWDERLEIMFGLKPGTFGKNYSSFENLVNEEDLSHLQIALDKTFQNDSPYETVFRTKNTDIKTKYISSKAVLNRDEEGKPLSMLGVCFDVTGLKEDTERLLSKLNEELLRSNKELENFAYVASHDLQEPLRMVSSFTQLLEQKYKDNLDEKALEYIHFAVDGSKRMYDLLNGLLDYSRIKTKGKEFKQVNLNLTLESAKKNLTLTIKERNAIIKSDELPSFHADESQMIHLFQNLISNSIKFSTNDPRIFISSQSDNDQYVISVKDEGIGIESQYFEKIFQIFQRLHPKEQYEGTGIGLAICRRIVERHGGRIWVESEIGKGSTFFFTISKSSQL